MKFGTIVVDPPWAYERTSRHPKLTGYATEEYPLLSTAELAKLPVGDFAADDCVLLLWTTFPFVSDAIQLCEAWGFKYVTGLAWVKTKGEQVTYGVGYWFRGAVELILVGRKGKAFRTNYVGLIAPGLHHSRKPDDIYELCSEFPGPKLELFARSYDDEPDHLKGWYQLGFEVAQDGCDIRDRLAQMTYVADSRWEAFRVDGTPPKARKLAPRTHSAGVSIDEFRYLVQDGVLQQSPDPTRYREVAMAVKKCTNCHHWSRFHPEHGKCVGTWLKTWAQWQGHKKCDCTEFGDPEPGRPDQVYTREQIDRMQAWRWNQVKDRIFLMKDGRYGLWDEWSSDEWKAPPGTDFNPEPPPPDEEVAPEALPG